MSIAEGEDPRAPRRVRHELKRRLAEVSRVEPLSPSMVRVHLAGDDLKGFASAGFDDHVKLFFPAEGEAVPTLPTFGPNGPVFPEGAPRPIARDYTPRLFDAGAGTLAIDFALHESGPATGWARAAKPGDRLGIGGPRGSIVLSTAFDGFVLIGDDTALPAIARRLGELPEGAPVMVLAEIDGPGHEIAMPQRPGTEVHWLHRSGRRAGEADLMLQAMSGLAKPAGDVQIWIAAESAVAKTVRHAVIETWGANPKWVKAAGYWRRGASGVHDHID